MKETFIYLYTAKFYNPDGKEEKESGMLYAEDYKDVFQQIIAEYGDDLIDITVRAQDAYAPLRFSEENLPCIEALIGKLTY